MFSLGNKKDRSLPANKFKPFKLISEPYDDSKIVIERSLFADIPNTPL